MTRAMLPAPVSPMVALWLLGKHGDEMRAAAETYARRGMVDVSRQFIIALAQLRAAAAQLSNAAVAAAVSADGSTETEIAIDLEESEISTAEAADRLGLTRERVCQLLNAGELLGRKSGRAWRVYGPSVDDLIDARRAA
ncbi:helix-turn-helix domain-containing protein [Kribbella sp. NPDC051587]|uniref:helix-turn-helix domain-containing protein n=1 Tax=Kribbella sp. NPDC051587 TaxID=3364119 RepID=UPI0037A479E1